MTIISVRPDVTIVVTGIMKRAIWLRVLMTVWSMTKRMSTDGAMSLARTGYWVMYRTMAVK